METQNKKFFRYKSSIKLSPIEMSIKTAWLTPSQLNQRKKKKRCTSGLKQTLLFDLRCGDWSIIRVCLLGAFDFNEDRRKAALVHPSPSPFAFSFILFAFQPFLFLPHRFWLILCHRPFDICVCFNQVWWLVPRRRDWNWVPQRIDQSLWEPHCPPNLYHLRYPKFWFESNPFVIY